MPSKTPIGFYIENYSTGGLERLLFDLLNHVPLERFHPILFYAGDKTFPERLRQTKTITPELVWVPVHTTKHLEESVWAKRPPRILWLAFLGIIDWVRWLFAWLNVGRCRDVLSKHPVVNLHVINGGYPAARSCLSALLAARQLKIPMVYMTVTAKPQRRRWPIVEAFFDRRVERSANVVISNCDYLTNVMRQTRGFNNAKTTTIYSGIPLLAPPSAAGVEALRRQLSLNGRPLIGSVAVLQHHKGHSFLLKALATLKGEFPEIGCLLIGDGVERAKLEELASALGIRNNVCFAGHRNDFRAAIAAMDLFVHPSLDEGLPYVISEAMALSKPIVATRIAGVPEQIVDGVTGLLVPPADADALAESIRKLLRDKPLANRLAENARERVHLFTEEAMMRKFDELYGENPFSASAQP